MAAINSLAAIVFPRFCSKLLTLLLSHVVDELGHAVTVRPGNLLLTRGKKHQESPALVQRQCHILAHTSVGGTVLS